MEIKELIKFLQEGIGNDRNRQYYEIIIYDHDGEPYYLESLDAKWYVIVTGKLN